jgi:hypothetical protein
MSAPHTTLMVAGIIVNVSNEQSLRVAAPPPPPPPRAPPAPASTYTTATGNQTGRITSNLPTLPPVGEQEIPSLTLQ